MDKEIEFNDLTISALDLPGKKRPVLALSFDGSRNYYPVATFKNEKAAHWFMEVMEEFLEKIVTGVNRDAAG